jgi:peptidoglycan hydrolase-like protein with peptidoglycan-binding domain
MSKANVWLHLEVLPSRWSDTRTVAEMLGVKPSTSGVLIVQGYRKTVKQGSQGKMAKLCQQQINLIAGQGVAEDGNFGSQSVTALKNVQMTLGLTADGVCGQRTWQGFEDAIKTQTQSGDWD